MSYGHAAELQRTQPPLSRLEYLVSQLGVWAELNPSLRSLHSEFETICRELADQDIQRRYLDVRLAIAYRAVEIMQGYKDGVITEDDARDRLTALPRTRPPELYPASYRRWYDALLKAHASARHRTRQATIASRVTVALAVILGIYGIYIQRYGIHHGSFWQL
jgi:hypothetical protein